MAIDALSQPSTHEGLEEAAVKYMFVQDGRDSMEDASIKGAFKAGANWRDAQIPKLPDNLDEAARVSMPKPNGIESNMDFSFFQMIGMFEQGAKWMAGRGVSGIGSLHYANQGEGVKDELELFFHDIFPDNEWEEGENVIVQIRKK